MLNGLKARANGFNIRSILLNDVDCRDGQTVSSPIQHLSTKLKRRTSGFNIAVQQNLTDFEVSAEAVCPSLKHAKLSNGCSQNFVSSTTQLLQLLAEPFDIYGNLKLE